MRPSRKVIDFVVVEKLDRLHRNMIESRKFIDLCDEMGVKFYRLDDGLVDFKDRSSSTLLSVMMSLKFFRKRTYNIAKFPITDFFLQ